MKVKATGIIKSHIMNVKVGQGRCNRFIRSGNLSLSHRTSIHQITADFLEKMLNFQQYVIKPVKKLCI
jgi:hypothetical protein